MKRLIPFLFAMLLPVTALAQQGMPSLGAGSGGGGGGGGVTSITAGTGISVNQSTGAVTITNTGLPLVQLIGTPTQGSGTTSVSVNTVTGTSVGDLLVMCAGATVKPTTVISCPSGWTSLITGGQLSDGTNQSQTVICSRVVTGGESGSYSPTWTGTTASAGALEIALRGLVQSTSVDATYAAGNTSNAQVLVGLPASPVGLNELNIACGITTAGGMSMVPNPVVTEALAASRNIQMGMGLGTCSGALVNTAGAQYALAGILLH